MTITNHRLSGYLEPIFANNDVMQQMPEEGGKMASLMACLSPREINIDVKRFTRRTWVHDLASQVHTGDIILFSSKHSASYITKFFTQSGVPAP